MRLLVCGSSLLGQLRWRWLRSGLLWQGRSRRPEALLVWGLRCHYLLGLRAMRWGCHPVLQGRRWRSSRHNLLLLLHRHAPVPLLGRQRRGRRGCRAGLLRQRCRLLLHKGARLRLLQLRHRLLHGWHPHRRLLLGLRGHMLRGRGHGCHGLLRWSPILLRGWGCSHRLLRHRHGGSRRRCSHGIIGRGRVGFTDGSLQRRWGLGLGLGLHSRRLRHYRLLRHMLLYLHLQVAQRS